MTVGLEFDLVAIIVVVIGAIIAFVKMQQEIQSNKNLQSAEIENVVKTLSELKSDFKDDLETLKDDLKEHIGQTSEMQSKALDDTKAELKEDINRLERKQAESNNIKERLATVEFLIKNLTQR